MNVLFVSSLQAYCRPDKPLYDQNAVSPGISHISSFLKASGNAVRSSYALNLVYKKLMASPLGRKINRLSKWQW